MENVVSIKGLVLGVPTLIVLMRGGVSKWKNGVRMVIANNALKRERFKNQIKNGCVLNYLEPMNA